MGILERFVGLVKDLAETLKDNEAWGVVAFLLLLMLWQFIIYRRDMFKLRADEMAKDKSISDLLEHRHEKYEQVFERSIEVIADNRNTMASLDSRVEDLEDRVDAMDKRCDERQRAIRQTDSERRRRKEQP